MFPMDSLGLIQQVLCGWFRKNRPFGGVPTIQSAVFSVLIEGGRRDKKIFIGKYLWPVGPKWRQAVRW